MIADVKVNEDPPVGDIVGSTVGLYVGVPVSGIVLRLVGDCVVGCRVGGFFVVNKALGTIDGPLVSFNEGEELGCCVGDFVRAFVGNPDGSRVGLLVSGILVRCRSIKVGEAIAATDGAKVGLFTGVHHMGIDIVGCRVGMFAGGGCISHDGARVGLCSGLNVPTDIGIVGCRIAEFAAGDKAVGSVAGSLVKCGGSNDGKEFVFCVGDAVGGIVGDPVGSRVGFVISGRFVCCSSIE